MTERGKSTGIPHREMATEAARRRYLVVLFSDLSNSALLADAMETEDYAGLLSKLRSAYEEVIRRHGGTIVQIQGDGFLASFGYPESREDDGRRATEAALELHAFVRCLKLEFPLPEVTSLHLHSGIHSGLVLLDEGDAVRGRLDLLGSAVNIAARLSDVAEADEILVTQETLGAETYFFETDAGSSVKLQGIADSVLVYKIFGRAPVGTRLEARAKRGLTPFIGRQAELRTLIDRLHAAAAGKLKNLAIVGPPGLGKTRLAEEFLLSATVLDCQICRGYCESYLSAEPLQPFLQILRTLCRLNFGMSAAIAAKAVERTLRGIYPGLVAELPALLRALSLGIPATQEAGATQLAPEKMIAAIVRLFDALSATKPLILFIDDWQWADDATRQVIGQLRGLNQRHILVLVATREFAPGDIGMSDAEIVYLRPFTDHEAEQTIRALLTGRDKFIVEEIRNYSGGNPLFVEELCHSVAHDRRERRRGRKHMGEAWLDKLIEARVERLPPAQAELVRTAAIIGNVIPSQVLEAITGLGEHHPDILALAEQDLIYPGDQRGTLRFKHGIARDVIYDSVGLLQRKAKHMQVAQALRQQISSSSEELYEPLAYHYAAAGQAAEAARYAELAGDKAMAASALDRAQVQYLAAIAAIDLLARSDENYQRRMLIAQRLALACVFDPSREQLQVLLRAVELAVAHDDQQGIALSEYWSGYIYYALGESSAAIGHLEIAQDFAQRGNIGPLVTQIRATLGQAYAAACDYEKSLALLDEAIDTKRQRQRSSRPAVGFAYTLASKGSVLGDLGRFEQAYACFDEALNAVRGAGHEVEGSILCWRSGVSLWQGRWDEASRSALEAQRVAERVKSLYLYAMSLSLGAYATWRTASSSDALQTIVDATSWLESQDKRLFISLNYGWLAQGMVDSKQWPRARSYAARALTRSRVSDRIGEAMALRAMARASAAGQNRKPVEIYLGLAMENAIARSAPHEIAVTRLCDAEIRLSKGDRKCALELIHRAEAAFQEMGMTWYLNAAQRLRQLA